MTPETSQTIMTAIGAVLGTKLLEKAAGVIWRKASGTDYMTRKDCDAAHELQLAKSAASFVTCKDCEICTRESEAGMNGLKDELKRDMAVIRGILVAIAVKSGIPESEWQKLVK